MEKEQWLMTFGLINKFISMGERLLLFILFVVVRVVIVVVFKITVLHATSVKGFKLKSSI